jgi:hypothetical protein
VVSGNTTVIEAATTSSRQCRDFLCHVIRGTESFDPLSRDDEILNV